jgi:hypothetical protein
MHARTHALTRTHRCLFVDVMPKAAGKGLALRYVRQQLLDMDAARCIVAGDSGNDVAMFESEMSASTPDGMLFEGTCRHRWDVEMSASTLEAGLLVVLVLVVSAIIDVLFCPLCHLARRCRARNYGRQCQAGVAGCAQTFALCGRAQVRCPQNTLYEPSSRPCSKPLSPFASKEAAHPQQFGFNVALSSRAVMPVTWIWRLVPRALLQFPPSQT